MTAELSGFRMVNLHGIRVELDRTATVRVRLEVAPVSETVEVTAASSAIDVTNATTGLNATADLYTRIPMDRSFFAVARVAPGTQQDEVGPAFYGSTGAENQYVIDGLNVTGIDRGGGTKQELNFDFVEEVEVKTGGLPAEYGRTTGGILNVLTKSGGNDFHGSAFGFFAGGGLQSDDRTAAQRPGRHDDGRRHLRQVRLRGGAGRPHRARPALVLRCLQSRGRELRYDGDPGPGSPGAPAVGAVVDRQTARQPFRGQAHLAAAASSTLALSVFGDPGALRGARRPGSTAHPAPTEGTTDSGGTNSTARYEGTFGGSFLVRALLGGQQRRIGRRGPGTSSPRFDDYTSIRQPAPAASAVRDTRSSATSGGSTSRSSQGATS